MQANGAEMMRLAASMGVAARLSICAPIHDALLLKAPLDKLEEDVFMLKGVMVKASEIIMQSIVCRVDAEIVRYPDRYRDEGGGEMWDRVMTLLTQTNQERSQ